MPFLRSAAGRVCVLLALAKLVLLLPIATRYGWHGDELYYLQAGRHLDWGYVDFPPGVAALAWVVDGVAGPSLFSLRLAGALLAAVAAVAAGALAREFGAGPRLQVLATGAFMLTPFGLGGATTAFNPAFLELAATALAMLAGARLLVRADPRQWLLLGLWGGLGLESEYTIAVPLAAFLAGCALWRRDLLLRREAAFGVVIALGAAGSQRDLGDQTRLDLRRLRLVAASDDGGRLLAAASMSPSSSCSSGWERCSSFWVSYGCGASPVCDRSRWRRRLRL